MTETPSRRANLLPRPASRLSSDEEPLDGRFKGFPLAPDVTVSGVGAQGWNVRRGDMPLPLMTLRQTHLRHNLGLMANWCREHDVSLAPHGKTTMAPELVRQQLEHGAWAITAASVTQAQIFVSLGIRRIILANQITDPYSLRWTAEVVSSGEVDLMCLVDSVEGVALLRDQLGRHGARLDVLVEVGFNGGRTGCRTVAQALRVSEAVRSTKCLRLRGIEAFEGITRSARRVDTLLARVARTAQEFARRGQFAGLKEIVLTVGGSAFFDRVVDQLSELDLGQPYRLVLRSGCYLTHDVGQYDHLSPLGYGAIGQTRLKSAIEIWASVLSRPEPELAVLGAGKRDMSFDMGLPVPYQIDLG